VHVLDIGAPRKLMFEVARDSVEPPGAGNSVF
jgi:hypothetical protein